MGRFDGKVAFITGGARGQGRSHAVLMAEEGANIITLDICSQIGSVEAPMSTPEDLEETVRLVEKTGCGIVARQADVRDFDSVKEVLEEGVREFGRLDFVLANAGIMPMTGSTAKERVAFYDAVSVMLTGVFHTCEAAIPTLIEQGEGGSMVLTSSSAGLKGFPTNRDLASAGTLGYTAAKHGVVGLMRSYANALAPNRIRCNSVHPTAVASPMVVNEEFNRWCAEYPDVVPAFANPFPVDMIEPADVSRAIMFLCSEEARYVTGVAFPVDAGICNK